MRNFIKNIIVLSVIVITSYLLCVLLFTFDIIDNKIPNVKNLTGKGLDCCILRYREIENIDKIDVLFVGPSHTYRGFDTRIFADSNINSFNMGSSNQSPVNSYYLLKKYLKKIHPKTIIFEVSSETLEIDGNESSIELLSNLPFSWEMVEMGVNTKNNVVTMNSMVGTYLKRLIIPLNNIPQDYDANNNYISGGYVEYCGINNSYADIINNPIITPHKSIVEPIQIKYYEKIIDLIKERGINLIIISTPITPEYKRSIINYIDIKALISNIAKSNGVKYVDFNDSEIFNAMGIKTDIHFIDYTHLNKQGVEIFNKYIIKNLFKANSI